MTPDRQQPIEDPAGDLVGRTFGAYRIVSKIGVGGMGEVYLARDSRLGREVAVKVLPPALTADVERRARFEREARVLATFSHSHIGAIYGLEDLDGQQALVLEYVPGETLQDRLSHGRVKLADALVIARQIADALDTAHEKGIIHRDLKPANIKVGADTRVKVLDFGLAKATSGDGAGPDLTLPTMTATSTGVGAIVGTPQYMSPEQARGQAVDKRADIWAFGCVVYEMLTGRSAFSGTSLVDVIAAVLEREPDWTGLPASTPPELSRLLRRCLEKDVAKRARDIGDVRTALEDIASIPAIEAEPAQSSHGRSWLAAAAVLVAASAVAAVLLWAPSNVSPTPTESPLANARFVQLTDFDGDEADGVLSRDGKFVAFFSDRDGPMDLWLTQPGTGRFVNLTPGPADDRMSDRSLGFDPVGFTADGSDVWLAGRPTRTMQLVPLLGGLARPFLDEGVNNAAWSPDGTRIVYARSDPGDSVVVANRTGGEPRRIFVTSAGQHNHSPTWSIDGSWIYFLHGMPATFDLDIWRISPSGGTPERVTAHRGGITSFAQISGRELLFTGLGPDYSGPWLWRFDLETRTTQRMSAGVERYTSVSANRDGNLVVATVANPIEKLWSVPFGLRPVTDRDERAYAVPTVRAVSPRFAAGELYYVSGGPGGGLVRTSGRDAVEIWRGAETPLLEAPAVTKDGRLVAVVTGTDGRGQLAMMTREGASFRRLSGSLNIRGPVDWSPDAAWIVASGIADGQGAGLFKVAADGSGTTVKIADGEVIAPIWSPTEDLIVYLGPNVAGSSTLHAVRSNGTRVELPSVAVRYPAGRILQKAFPRFTPDGRGIVFVQSGETFTKGDFWVFDVESRLTRQLSRFQSGRSIGAFDFTPDGRELVYGRSNDNGNLVLIDLRGGPAAASSLPR